MLVNLTPYEDSGTDAYLRARHVTQKYLEQIMTSSETPTRRNIFAFPCASMIKRKRVSGNVRKERLGKLDVKSAYPPSDANGCRAALNRPIESRVFMVKTRIERPKFDPVAPAKTIEGSKAARKLWNSTFSRHILEGFEFERSHYT